ncbi:hypothetical protein IU449_22620 [Nocardia higoensis]|uniref:Uncharacterized protein n=1 Tax=Nocardia higoensis TaxID=228599 RepID=A0ABS0DFU7_9NOCA|nr:ABC-three component system middle component 6 [Nocardia higoensis]MBF6357304.1 hypothetical protein [Nocardia higoensis]
MLLPTKGVSVDRAMITVGADLLEDLCDPLSVSALWERYSERQRLSRKTGKITFDWFSLSLAALYAMRLIDISADGYLRRTHVS